MTRKDYKLIADSFASTLRQIELRRNDDTRVEMVSRNLACYRAVEQAAEELANALQDDNPSFDMKRFLKACGVME